MFGRFDIAVILGLLTWAVIAALIHVGYLQGVKETEERWTDAVGRHEAQRRERCARNGCTNA